MRSASFFLVVVFWTLFCFVAGVYSGASVGTFFGMTV